MVEWMKIYPTAANKIFITEVDEDSPTGFGISEKSISDFNTLLGSGARKGTTTEREALALTLDASDEGDIIFWDTTLKAQFIWNGTEFV